MRGLVDVVAKLQNVDEILLDKIKDGYWTNLDEHDELYAVRGMLFKLMIQIKNIQDYYGD